MKVIFVFFLLFFSSFFNELISQEVHKFRNIDVNMGLSDNTVFSVLKDSYDFMWFGTSAGINRYDGYKFVNYKRSKFDNKPLFSNGLLMMLEDGESNLWVKVNQFYFIYNRKKDYFDSNVFNKLKEYQINITDVDYFTIDTQKDLWVYDSKALYYYCFTSKVLRVYKNKGGSTSLGVEKISDLQCRDNRLFIIYKSGIIECIDIVSGNLIWKTDKISSIFKGKLLDYFLYLDTYSVLWVYTEGKNGLWNINTQSREWEYFSTQSAKNRLSNNVIRSVLDDEKGNVWIATEYAGINVYNVQSKKISYIQNNFYDNSSLKSNSSSSLYLDDSNTMWIGHFRKGVSYTSLNSQRFKTYFLGDNSNVNAITEDEQGNMWFGTNGNGLIKLLKNNQKLVFHKGLTAKSSDDIVVCQHLDSKSRLWIGYYMDDMGYYKDGQFHKLLFCNNQKSPIDNSVWAIDEDRNGNIWFGTLKNGLYCFNSHSQTIDSFNVQNSILQTDNITDLHCNRSSKLYIGTSMGLYEMELNKKFLSKILGNKKQSQLFPDSMINCVFKDSRDLLWVGTPSGVSVYDEKNDTIKFLNSSNGLSGNYVRGMIEDDNRNIWITTNNGITNVVVQRFLGSRDYEFSQFSYYEEDGLQGADFNDRAIFKTQNGDIYVGGPSGYNIITPKKINSNNTVPNVIFTGLNIYNNNIDVDSVYSGHVILDKSIYLTNDIQLNYSDNTFFVEFSAMNYFNTSKIKYAYRLKEESSEWIYLNNNNRVYFTNLNAGTYTLQVKAANNNGFWSEVPSSIKIKINPPFWLSFYAYFLYSIIIVIVVLLSVRYSKNKIKAKMQVHKYELDTKKSEEMNEMRLRFFTNISHDFRTPLSLIITPIEKLMNDYKSEPIYDKLKIIHQSANSLLNLVNQLLDFRRLDVKADVLNLSHGDIVAYLKEICSTFDMYAEEKNILLTLRSDVRKIDMAFDKDKIYKVMMNLLSNAFKYSEQNSTVIVSIKVLDVGRTLSVQVIDEGVGIIDSDKSKVFERFYQVSQPKINSGSGIGLHIAKEYVKLHDGEINVTNNTPKGSIFSFNIPIRTLDIAVDDSDDYNEDEVIDIHENIDFEDTMFNKPNADSAKSAILLVEDNENFRNFVRDCLIDKYEVFVAENGKKAISVLKNVKIDIVISDVMMPIMSGFELCTYIKNDINFSHLPVILLTARTAEEHIVEGLNAGADDYIAKPFNIEILNMRIEKFIEWNKRSHEKFKSIDVSPNEITICSLDEQFITKAIKAVEDNASNPNLSVSELSTILGMSRGCLYKKILYITGKTPIEFIHIVRTKMSIPYLLKSQMNVSEIAYKVGYNSPKVYAKYFKIQFNMTPSEYIKQNNGSIES